MQRGFNPRPPILQREKRYGWYRCYNDFVGHPKWRLVAQRSGVHLAFVHVIAAALFQAASKARKRGWIGKFDFEECAIATDIPVQDIAAVCRAFNEIGWLSQEFIVDWFDRQPDQEDPTAALRQQIKRDKDKAKRAAQMGTASPEQEALLSAVDREAIARAGAPLSRVMVPELQRPAERPVLPFLAVVAEDNTPAVIEAARGLNDRAARAWLFGQGGKGEDFGPASKIVAGNMGQLRPSGHLTLLHWLQEIGGDAVTLATIVSAAEQQALTGDGFIAVVKQRIAAVVSEQTNGPRLPLRPPMLSGGRGAA